MNRIYIFGALTMLFILGFMVMVETQKTDMTIQTPDVREHYIGKVKLNDRISIRLLVLKHCPDNVADTDANQAVQAANLAASKGLKIKDIGNHHIDAEGQTPSLVWGQKCSISDLKGFVSEQMRVDAEPGDTLIIYTIGHGGGGGTIMRLGQREGVMKMLAEAAEENDQETFWWQLSCHAAAKLPPISILNERQQELFAMTASSPANKLSYFCTQGEIMEKVFGAIAEDDRAIDPDGDDIIIAGELTDFLNTVSPGRGDLVYARSPNEPIFGWTDWANRIPIHGPRGPEEYDPRYIPHPKWRDKIPIPTKR